MISEIIGNGIENLYSLENRQTAHQILKIVDNDIDAAIWWINQMRLCPNLSEQTVKNISKRNKYSCIAGYLQYLKKGKL